MAITRDMSLVIAMHSYSQLNIALCADLHYEGTPVLQLVCRLAGARRHVLGSEPEALAVWSQHCPRIVAPASGGGRIEGSTKPGNVDLAECALALAHHGVNRAGEVVYTRERQYH